MRYPKISVFAISLLASISLLVACGDDDDDGDNGEPNQQAPNTHNGDNGNNANNGDGGNNGNGNNGNNGDDDLLPLDGIYEVTSHQESGDDCDDLTDLDEFSHVQVSGQIPPGNDTIIWSMNGCDSASEESCTESTLSIPGTPLPDDLESNTLYENRHIDTASGQGTECLLEGTGSELMITDEDIVVRNLVLELEFDTNEQDWDCETDSSFSDEEPSQATRDAMECIHVEELSASLIETL